MQTMTIKEFEKLVSEGTWERTQDVDIIETDTQKVDVSTSEDEYEQKVILHSWGVATLKSECDGLLIAYTESFNFDNNMPDTFTHGTEGQDEVWELHGIGIPGVQVVDEDGDVLNAHELADYLDDSFSTIDYSELELKEITDIDDVDEDTDMGINDMETFTLEIDNEPSLRFTGELVANVASSDNQATGSSYSGQTGRWTELLLYKTTGGKFVCHQIGRTRWEGERDRFSGKVCKSLEEVKAFFGHRWLAKELYHEAKIDDVVDVEDCGSDISDKSFLLTTDELADAQYYASFGCPEWVGEPEFEPSPGGDEEPVVWICETDYTKSELDQLKRGEVAVEKIAALLKAIYSISGREEEFFERIGFYLPKES